MEWWLISLLVLAVVPGRVVISREEGFSVQLTPMWVIVLNGLIEKRKSSPQTDEGEKTQESV